MPRPSHSPAYDKFRAALVKAREDSGLSQREVSRMVGQSPAYMNKVESGYRRIDVVELIAVLEVMDVDSINFIRKLVTGS